MTFSSLQFIDGRLLSREKSTLKVITMSVDYDKDAVIGRNDRNAIRSLNSTWKRVPIDTASENVVDLITQIQHCKRYDSNGGWEHVCGILVCNYSSQFSSLKLQQTVI